MPAVDAGQDGQDGRRSASSRIPTEQAALPG